MNEPEDTRSMSDSRWGIQQGPKRRWALVLIATLLLLFSVGLIVHKIALAQEGDVGAGSGETETLLFGGFIPWAFYCTCSGNWLLFVTPPNPGFFMYEYTAQYPFYMLPWPSIWTLGLYNQGGECEIYVGEGCITYTPTGTITETEGTSLP